jgi:hypothetical protein
MTTGSTPRPPDFMAVSPEPDGPNVTRRR